MSVHFVLRRRTGNRHNPAAFRTSGKGNWVAKAMSGCANMMVQVSRMPESKDSKIFRSCRGACDIWLFDILGPHTLGTRFGGMWWTVASRRLKIPWGNDVRQSADVTYDVEEGGNF